MTGEILLGEVVFEPGPIRVTSVTPSVGASIAGGGGGSGSSGGGGGAGGTVLTATGTTPVVTVDLGVSQEYLVKPGDGVSVVMPDGTTTVGGHVETVGTVATCREAAAPDRRREQRERLGWPVAVLSAGSNGSAGATHRRLWRSRSTWTRPAGRITGSGPVNVNITTQTVSNVLAVPVNALLALQGGGIGVDW